MKVFATLLALVLSTVSTAAPKPLPNQKKKGPPEVKVIVIDGPITGQTMAPVSQYIDSLLAESSVPRELDMVINSPGGSVTAGFIFLDRMTALRRRGTKIHCHVAEVAASMAFQILLQCDDRTAMDTSFLLWHRARVYLGGLFGQAMTGPDLYAVGVQLKELDEHIYRDVSNAIPKAPAHYLRFHFERETLHTGANLANAVPDFISLDSTPEVTMWWLANSGAIRTAKAGLFDDIKFGELIYIWDHALEVELSNIK